MKKATYQFPKSSFISIEKDMGTIVDMMLKNNRLKKLLYYNLENCLFQENLTEDQSLELIEDGYIYLCETPKYEILCEDKYYYATNNDELEEIEKNLEGKKYKVFYIKGLAELNADTMAMCLEPGYKNVTQIRVDDILEARKSLELHMGSNVKDRKDYIMNNFDKVGGYYEN